MSATLGALAELTGGRLLTAAASDVAVDDVAADTRRVNPGALFACVPGAVHDGHDLAPDAVAAGAIALAVQRPLGLDVPQILIEHLRPALGPMADLVHDHPSRSLDVVGVTGTNGKTTIVSMLASILSAAGRSNATIGTLTGARTTPEAPELQRTLAELRDEGVTSVAMEVSSHALDQFRVSSVDFDVAVFTNLGSDHLDFHGTREAYFAAKAKLFEPGVARVSVLNTDDVHGRLLRDVDPERALAVTIADARNLERRPGGIAFDWNDVRIELPMHGTYNVMNALLAATAAEQLGVDRDAIAAGIAALPVVPGRFETFDLPSGAVAVVDFAHTPDALESALGASRELAGERGKVAVVFGCGGDRDRTKRPLMGAIAGDLADEVVITSDNPRSESAADIAAEIAAGVAGADPTVELDRSAAISAALSAAAAGDVVLVAGKGHETGQIVGDVVTPFDDREQVLGWIEAGGRSR